MSCFPVKITENYKNYWFLNQDTFTWEVKLNQCFFLIKQMKIKCEYKNKHQEQISAGRIRENDWIQRTTRYHNILT